MNAWHGTGQVGTGVRTCCAVRALGSEGRIDADLGPGSDSGASSPCSYLARQATGRSCTVLPYIAVQLSHAGHVCAELTVLGL